MKRNKMNTGITWMLVLALSLFSHVMFSQPETASRSGKKATATLSQMKKQTENRGMMSSIDSAWIHYDDMDLYDSWGFLTSGEEYDVIAKWDPQDLTDYDGWEITKVKFIVVNNLPDLWVKVWEGSNFTEIYSQSLDSYNVNTWTVVTLDSAIQFDATKELYVGYHVDMTQTEGGFVTATDDGPPENGYGNLIRWDGAWYSLYNNHNLQVFIEANLNADFEADTTVICAGSTVNFTNLSTVAESYSWTFEGGTPSSSTDENPSITYSSPGVYDVTLEVTGGGETDTEYKQDYIHVIDIPGQADTPSGEDTLCTEQSYVYTTNSVMYAQDYEWEINPADAGTLTPDDTTATLWVADDWTGDFTLTVRATNMCGDGNWSDDFAGTVFQSPTAFTLEGGGEYCLGGEGVEITLDGSETGVSYELYLDGDPTGNTVDGTGSEISFGLITDEGYYTATASNGICSFEMDNQVQVIILFPPLEPETPTGPDVICDETSSDYQSDGSDDADSYVWELSPQEAGTLTYDNLTATVEWNADFNGLAYLSLYGINDCGDGDPSEALEISVGSPNPEIDGEDLVCDWSEEIYLVEDNDGSTYFWEVSGGSISDGQGTSTVSIAWEGEGAGSLVVTETTADSCVGTSEVFDVNIDNCTGISQNRSDQWLKVYPNPVADDAFTVINSSGQPVVIKLFGLDGRLILEEKFASEKAVIRLNGVPAGIYILSATFSDKTMVIKKMVRE